MSNDDSLGPLLLTRRLRAKLSNPIQHLQPISIVLETLQSRNEQIQRAFSLALPDNYQVQTSLSRFAMLLFDDMQGLERKALITESFRGWRQ